MKSFINSRLVHLTTTILVSAWVIFFQSNGAINNDGVLYLRVAQLFQSGDWNEGINLYNWPFYPWLIFLVNKITGFSLHASALILNMLFFTFAALGLTTMCKECGGKGAECAACLFLLLSSSYIIGTALPMVIKDHGFWACFLWSIVFFIRFIADGLWKNALCWGVLISTATLFRIEGIAYMLLLPFAILWECKSPLNKKIMMYVKANFITFLMGAIFVVLVLWFEYGNIPIHKKIIDAFFYKPWFYNQIWQEKALVISNQILAEDLSEYAHASLTVMLLWILLTKSVTAAGFTHSMVIALSFVFPNLSGSYPSKQPILAWIAAIAILVGWVEIATSYSLPGRYLLPLAFVIIVYASFPVASMGKLLYHNSMRFFQSKEQVISFTIFVVLATQLMVLVIPKKNISPEQQAVRWLEKKKYHSTESATKPIG